MCATVCAGLTLYVRTMFGWLMADMRIASIWAIRSLRASHSCSSGASALVLPAMIYTHTHTHSCADTHAQSPRWYHP